MIRGSSGRGSSIGPLVEAWQRYGHYRVGRTEAVFEALAPACLEQVVTGKEAFRAWRLLVREFGEPAPGPASEPGVGGVRHVSAARRPRPGPRSRAGDSSPQELSSGGAARSSGPLAGLPRWSAP